MLILRSCRPPTLRILPKNLLSAPSSVESSGVGVSLSDFDGRIPEVSDSECDLCRKYRREASSCRHPWHPHSRKSGAFYNRSLPLSHFRVEGDNAHAVFQFGGIYRRRRIRISRRFPRGAAEFHRDRQNLSKSSKEINAVQTNRGDVGSGTAVTPIPPFWTCAESASP